MKLVKMCITIDKRVCVCARALLPPLRAASRPAVETFLSLEDLLSPDLIKRGDATQPLAAARRNNQIIRDPRSQRGGGASGGEEPPVAL